MKEEIKEALESSEKHNRDARRKLEAAKKTLEEAPHSEQKPAEVRGLKEAIASSERAEREAGKSHSAREKAVDQRAETQRLMREADKEIHKTDKKIEGTAKK